MEVFAKFDAPRGAVTPELLTAVFAKSGADAPPREELEAFIESVYAEREAAEAAAKSAPAQVSVPVGTDGPEGGRPRRRFDHADNLQTGFEKGAPEVAHQLGAKTMWDVFNNTVAAFPDNKFYGTCSAAGEPYTWETYSQVAKHVEAVAAGLTAAGVKRQQFVGVMLDTCAEWGIIELALWRQAMVPVTLYSTYGQEAIGYCVNHSELTILFVSQKSLQMLAAILPKCPGLKQIVYLGEEADLAAVTIPEGVEVRFYTAMESEGAAAPVEAALPLPEDRALVIYTSGTTGNPKGVLHRHSGLVANCAANVPLVSFNKEDSHLAFLPMAHIMEQFLESLIFAVGGSVGFWSGDVRVLMQNVAALRPTKFIAVPRLLNRLYMQLRASFDALEGAKRAVFDAAMASKKHWLAKGVYKSFYDLLIFRKAAAALGGRCQMLATGSAPIDPGMLEFFRIVFSCPVVEGYGMTEVLITNLTYLQHTMTRSHVGPPSASCEMKLMPVPEMNYLTTTTPPRGEVCFRGPMNMVEYYKDPAKTAEAIDEDGWYHSGDIGEIYEDGALRLIDRIKHIFKLSQGEYVAPEKLEQTFVHSKYVAQIFINGTSLRSFLVSVVVPNPAGVESAMKELGITSQEELLASEAFNKLVLADLNTIGRSCGLFGFEIPKAVSFVVTPFETLDLLTPTFKMKRNEARKQFETLCDTMYASIQD